VRIGLLIYGSLETISGGNIYDRHLVDHLREQGEQVEVISLPWHNYIFHLGDNLSSGLLAELSNLEVDILIQDQLCHPSLFYLNRKLRRQARYPIVSLVHHLRCSEVHAQPAKRIYRLVEKAYLRSVDGFIFNSQTTRESVREFVPQLPDHIIAYPGGDRLGDGLQENQIRQRTQEVRPLRVLFLGSLTRRKGLKTLLRACEQLERGTVELTIIGSQTAEPRYARNIMAHIDKLKNELSITVLKALPAPALPEMMLSQDILVVPSSYEGFGIVYLEGMAFGLPAIASTSGAAHETIQHGQNGLLIDPGDNQTLARHLREIAADRGRLLTLSLRALETHRQGPTWKGMASRVHEFLLSYQIRSQTS
jgi:glycosyltransferase involved in cell wall biosynthesis